MDYIEFAEQVLDLASRVSEQAEVFALHSQETPVSFEANRLKRVETKETQGVALRLVKDGRIGFASTTRLDDPQALVEHALTVAPFGAKARFQFPEATPANDVPIYDPQVAAWPVEGMVEVGQRMIDRVRAENSDVLCEVELYKEVSRVHVRNSRGGEVSYHQTEVSAMLDVNLVRGTDILDIYEGVASVRLDVDYDELVRTVLEKLRLSERIVPIRTGPMPVIFTPKGLVITLGPALESAFNGRLVLEGASPLAGKLGEAMLDERLYIYDDGRLPWAIGSAPCDDEGVPTRRTPLIEGGVIRGFYYDLQTAGLAGVESTGNGGRSLGNPPSPSLHTVVIAPGDTPFSAMLADIEEGLLVDQTMGAWSANVLAGEFSGNVHLGFKIERGELVGRVKDTMVSGNVFKALGDLKSIGDKAHWVWGEALVPYLCFRALSVASK